MIEEAWERFERVLKEEQAAYRPKGRCKAMIGEGPTLRRCILQRRRDNNFCSLHVRRERIKAAGESPTCALCGSVLIREAL